ncbi:hypothetical protein RYX36_008868 [Vicia faba]
MFADVEDGSKLRDDDGAKSLFFREPSPIALNTALAQLRVIKLVFRLPYVPLNMEQRVEFVKLWKEMGRENFVGEKYVQVLDDDDFIVVSQY